MRWFRAVFLCLSLSSIMTPSMLLAQKAPTGKNDKANTKEAQGRELLAKAQNVADYDAAIVALQEAYDLSQNPEVLYLIAKAYDKKGNDQVAAKSYYEQYVAEKGGNPPELQEIEARLSAIDADLAAKRAAAAAASRGNLLLEIDPSGAIVEIEDKKVGVSPMTAPLPYQAGSLTVRVSKDGYKEYLTVLDVEASETTKVKITLEKEGKTRWGLIAAVAAGVIAGGVGATVAIVGNSNGDVNGISVGDLGVRNF
jgi:tetratricopeptide (TPR) repeat protein